MKLSKLFKSVFVFCVLGSAISTSLFAEEFKSVAALSVASYSDVDSSLEKFFETVGYKEFHDVLTMVTNGIDGIDKSKPAGFVLLGNGNDLLPFVFLPIADVDSLTCPGIEVLKEKLNYDPEKKTIALENPAEDDENEAGSGDEFRLIEENGWLFVTPVKYESMIPTQTDPTNWFEGLDAKYLISGVIHVDRVPAEVVDSLFSSLRVVASKDDSAANRLQQLGAISDYVKANIQCLEFGVSVDRDNGDLVFSSTAVPVPDSSYAKSLNENTKPVTLWSDFYDPARSILAIAKSEIVDPETAKFQKGQWDSLVETALDAIPEDGGEAADDLSAVESLAKDWQAWADENYDTCKTDSALSIGIDGTISLASTIVDGEQLLRLVENTANFVKQSLTDDTADNKDAQKILNSLKINANQYKGYTVSTFIVPISALDKSYSFLIGIKDDAFVMIAGLTKKTVSDLFKEKAGLQRTKTESAQQWVFSVPNLAKFAQTFEEIAGDENFSGVVQKVAEGNENAVIVGKTECSSEQCYQSVTIKSELIKLICDTFQQEFQSENDGSSDTEGDAADISESEDLF